MAKYLLRLYITGQTSRSLAAIANLKRTCEAELPGDYEMEVIDILDRPQRAEDEQIFATPTVVRVTPPPARRFIGDLSDPRRVLAALGLKPVADSVSLE